MDVATFSHNGYVDGGLPYASPLRRRRRAQGVAITPTLAKTAAVIFIVGSASVVLLQYNNNNNYPSVVKTQLVARLSTLQHEKLPALQQTLSAKLQGVPRRLGRRESFLKGEPSTELEWEKRWERSENAYNQLRHVPDKEEVMEDKNPLERALEGILHLGQRNTEGRRQKRRGDSKNNLRKEEGRNKQRNMKAGGGSKANPYQGQAIQQPQEEGEQRQESSFFSFTTTSPLAAPLMAFFGVIFLTIAFVRPSQDRRRLDRLAHFHHQGKLILDEDEAEIVEFYEKEMECGGTIPFLQEAEEHPKLKRQGSSCGFERKLSDSSLTKSFRRSESDPGRGTSQGDLYYSRVLETLHYDDDDEEEYQVQLPAKEKEETEQKLDNGIDQECQITLFENISSLSEEDGDEAESGRKACMGDGSTKLSGSIEVTPHSPPHQLMGENDDDTCFVSAQSQGGGEEEDQEQSRPQSPQSTSSTISSLTLEPEYDIEAPPKKKDALSPLHELVAEVMAGPDTSLPTTDTTKSENCVSPTSATPPRGNLYQDRYQQQSIVKSEMKLSRRVSFSPDIKVREIPSTTRQHDELSPEMYLYIMLFFVAVAIAMFSFIPAHPTLSPVYSMTRGEMLERAEKMLSSQWDLEL